GGGGRGRAKLGFVGAIVMTLLGAVAALVPQVVSNPLAPVALVLVAAAAPVWLLITLRSRVRLLEESARQLSRGDWQRPLVSVDDEVLSPVFVELDALRRHLAQRDREGTAVTAEQDRS